MALDVQLLLKYFLLQAPLLLPPWFLNFKAPGSAASGLDLSSGPVLHPSLVSPLLYPGLKHHHHPLVPPPPPPLSFLLPGSPPPGLLFAAPPPPPHLPVARTGPGRRPKEKTMLPCTVCGKTFDTLRCAMAS